tara:strand:+ start:2601 stop:2873 length:273 start_codon:yes stop_codon:yes gene_type:complete
MSWKNIIKEDRGEDTPGTLAFQGKQNKLRSQMESGESVPMWTKRFEIVSGKEEKVGEAKPVVGYVINPNNSSKKKVNVYTPNIVLASEYN